MWLLSELKTDLRIVSFERRIWQFGKQSSSVMNDDSHDDPVSDVIRGVAAASAWFRLSLVLKILCLYLSLDIVPLKV